MTLIIGVKCSDGVVLGADGAATFTAGQQPTIRQPIKKKIKIHAGSIATAVSGSVGMGQRFAGEIGSAWSNKTFSAKKSFEVMQQIRSLLWKHIEQEMHIARVASQVAGPMSLQRALTACLTAMPIENVPCLFQFDEHGMPEEADADLPFVAIGLGQIIADPFLAFLRRIFWPDRLPTLSEGKFAAVWTLRHAIDTVPGGVGDPIQIVTLKQDGKNWHARDLDKSEWQENLQEMQSAENLLANFRQVTQKEPNAPPTP